MYKNIILPASLLAGTITGAGMFALPYVFGKAGILIGIFYLAVFSLVFVIIHLMYGDIILRTGENHRFSGYAGIYLGTKGKWLAFLTSVVGMLFVLTVYLVLSISFFNLFASAAGFFDVYKLLLFWFTGSLAVFIGINRLAISEFLITAGIAAIIATIFVYGLIGDSGKIFSAPLFNLNNIFLPYGAVLFSLSGRVAVPALLGYFRRNNCQQIKAKIPIILGSLAPALIYLLFVFGILSLSETVSEDAISGLFNRLPALILRFLGILGLICLWSSYIVIGRDIKKSLEHDLKFSGILAGFIVIAVPLFLYFLGFQNFLGLVALVGGIFISMEGILIVLIWLKARRANIERQEIFLKKINPLVVYFLLLIFVGGMIYEIIY